MKTLFQLLDLNAAEHIPLMLNNSFMRSTPEAVDLQEEKKIRISQVNRRGLQSSFLGGNRHF